MSRNYIFFENMKKKIQNYPKINQENLWKKWFELSIKKKEENKIQIDNEMLKKMIQKIHLRMEDLKVERNLIKNFIDNLNKSLFTDESFYYNISQSKKEYVTPA